MEAQTLAASIQTQVTNSASGPHASPPVVRSWNQQFQSQVGDYCCEAPYAVRTIQKDRQCVAVLSLVAEVRVALVFFLQQVVNGEREDSLHLQIK